ncbi:MAG: hypothetical protein HRT44_12960 [Bdellovibrionales bacterium]|nr:hypothetical protein [Bdellovibrionales bacterium]
MKMVKYILLAIVAVSMAACGEDNNTSPVNPININNPTDKDNTGEDNTGFSQTYQINSQRVETHFVTGNVDCNNKELHKIKLSPQRRQEIYQRLCQQAARRAERRLNRRCNGLIGPLQNVQLFTNTYPEKFQHCRSLNCEVRGTATCGVN